MGRSRGQVQPWTAGRIFWTLVLVLALGLMAFGVRLLFAGADGGAWNGGAVPPAAPAADGPLWGDGNQQSALVADANSHISAGDLPPSTLSLGRIGVTMPIGVSTTPGGILTPPEDVSTVGIWLGGSDLGAAKGTTLLAGHVNLIGQGQGALFNLALMQPGDVIHTADASGAVTGWQVTNVVGRPKSAGVDESVFEGDAGPRRLAVITCGGELDFTDGYGDYQDNTYLYAVPLRE